MTLAGNVITAIFPIENETYRAFSEIRHDMLNESCIVAQPELVKKRTAVLSLAARHFQE
ncbi:MAG: hypothetical protein II877_10520 [Synergistaceae bacterium]|nr:hypothetical protein [Synergistaceae bacterium]MBQ7168995.1 hypothetical protein [Synergistaceae bacterium]